MGEEEEGKGRVRKDRCSADKFSQRKAARVQQLEVKSEIW